MTASYGSAIIGHVIDAGNGAYHAYLQVVGGVITIEEHNTRSGAVRAILDAAAGNLVAPSVGK
jgi:hypothetical protein